MTLAIRPSFPPLFRDERATPGAAFATAIQRATDGTDAGHVVWAERDDAMEAALVLAPEAPLADAIGILFAAANGMADAIGALGPPETAVHNVWPGGLSVNGAPCGQLRVAASTTDAAAVPDWLVIGAMVRYRLDSVTDPGTMPDRTALAEEGCADVTPDRLLESWSRHTLAWINRWLDEGLMPLHKAWIGRATGIGSPLPADDPSGPGVAIGLDEHGGLLVRGADGATRVHPLTAMLDGTAR